LAYQRINDDDDDDDADKQRETLTLSTGWTPHIVAAILPRHRYAYVLF